MQTVMAAGKTELADGRDKHTMMSQPKTAPKVQINPRLAAALEHGKPVAPSNGVLDHRGYDLYLDDIESFAGLADVYVGSRGPSKRQVGSRHHAKKKKRKR